MKTLIIILTLLSVYCLESVIMYIIVVKSQRSNPLKFLANIIYVSGTTDHELMQIIANQSLPFGGKLGTFCACLLPINRWGFVIKNHYFAHCDQDNRIIQYYRGIMSVGMADETTKIIEEEKGDLDD